MIHDEQGSLNHAKQKSDLHGDINRHVARGTLEMTAVFGPRAAVLFYGKANAFFPEPRRWEVGGMK